MTMQFILILAYVASGEIHVEVGGYENNMQCAHAQLQQVEQANRIVLVADCIPVSKAWGLK